MVVGLDMLGWMLTFTGIAVGPVGSLRPVKVAIFGAMDSRFRGNDG